VTTGSKQARCIRAQRWLLAGTWGWFLFSPMQILSPVFSSVTTISLVFRWVASALAVYVFRSLAHNIPFSVIKNIRKRKKMTDAFKSYFGQMTEMSRRREKPGIREIAGASPCILSQRMTHPQIVICSLHVTSVECFRAGFSTIAFKNLRITCRTFSQFSFDTYF